MNNLKLNTQTFSIKKLIFNNYIIIIALFFASVPTQLQAQMILDNGFEGGEGVDWGGRNDGKPFFGVPIVARSSNDAREGNKSMDVLPNTAENQKRSEVALSNRKGDYDWGTEYWVGLSFKQLKDFENAGRGKNFGIIFQHHGKPHTGSDGKPDYSVCGVGPFPNDKSGFIPNPLTIKIKDKRLLINTSTIADNVNKIPGKNATWGTETVADLPIVKNKWHDLVIHFRYATNDTGFIEIWINGTKVVDKHNTVTVYALDRCGLPRTPQEFQKFGIYHGLGDEKSIGEMLFDSYRSGKGSSIQYENVSPLGLSPNDIGVPPSANSDCTLDADGNGTSDALTDGLLFTRYMFDIRGNALIANAVASNCTRCTAAEIEPFLAQCKSNLTSDIDGNGTVDALTDGLLITRYLFGSRGAALIKNSVANDCTRCTATENETYLKTLVP